MARWVNEIILKVQISMEGSLRDLMDCVLGNISTTQIHLKIRESMSNQRDEHHTKYRRRRGGRIQTGWYKQWLMDPYLFDDTSLLSAFLRFFLKWCVHADSRNNMLNEDIQIEKTEAMLIGFDVKHTPTHSKNIIALIGRRWNRMDLVEIGEGTPG